MTIEDLKIKDKSFSETDFISKVDNTYIMLLSSIINQNLDRIKHKLSNKLYERYSIVIKKLKANNEKQLYDELNVKSTQIIDIDETDNEYIIKVLLISRYMDYKIDLNTNMYKSGINDHRIEINNYLTFTKFKSTKNEDIVKYCPGCGGNIDSNNTGVCKYCGSIYNTKDYDWILSDLK